MARCGSPYRTELRTMGSRSLSLSCGQQLVPGGHGGSPEGEWDSACGQHSWTALVGCAAHWGQGAWWTRALLPLPPDAAPHGDAATRLHSRTLRPTGSGTQPGSDLARPGPACPLSTPHHSQHCGQAAGRCHQLQVSSGHQLPATADRGEGGRACVTITVLSLPFDAHPRRTTETMWAPWLPLPLSPKQLVGSPSHPWLF